jgi:glutathione S-transferase
MEHRSPELLKVNPMGQLPILIEADGWAMAERCDLEDSG